MCIRDRYQRRVHGSNIQEDHILSSAMSMETERNVVKQKKVGKPIKLKKIKGGAKKAGNKRKELLAIYKGTGTVDYEGESRKAAVKGEGLENMAKDFPGFGPFQKQHAKSMKQFMSRIISDHDQLKEVSEDHERMLENLSKRVLAAALTSDKELQKIRDKHDPYLMLSSAREVSKLQQFHFYFKFR
eukprot:TRINITY_DN7177_c0_g1_i3.p1 TRINITY_DN7177_c0_g1~~TRINITY_DN7177_c0_g1_i3.p1  ORF type:complete len:186 (-),score=41.68 TRINITY_DN7177_c0_g1_i3:337-894(-)